MLKASFLSPETKFGNTKIKQATAVLRAEGEAGMGSLSISQGDQKVPKMYSIYLVLFIFPHTTCLRLSSQEG
jgi:hypothetical protein